MHCGKVMVSSLGYEYLLHNAWYPGLLPNLCWNLKQTSWYYRIAFSQICSRILILMKAHFQWSCLCYPHKNDHMNTYQFTYINQSLRLYEKLSSVKVKFEMHHFQRCISWSGCFFRNPIILCKTCYHLGVICYSGMLCPVNIS